MTSAHTMPPTQPVPPAMEEDTLSSDTGEVLRRIKAVATSASAPAPFLGLPTEDKARKRLQIWTWLMTYFPDAILELVEVSIRGNEQHNPGQPLHWARGKSMDQMNTAFRHQWDYGRGIKRDTDGQYHLAKAAWRLLAQLQLDIEAERNA
jgi:hypothetical protein